MTEEPVKVATRIQSSVTPNDVTDNDTDEGIKLMEKKDQWPPQYVVDYMNKVRRGKIAKYVAGAIIAQIPLIIVLLLGR